MKRSIAAVLLAWAAAALVAQERGRPDSEAAKFWASAEPTDRDRHGNVIYTEIRDPKTFTTKVFLGGQWLTYHYRPNTLIVTSVDTPESTDELQYDASGAMRGVKVRTAGKTHELYVDPVHGTVSTPGMPEVTPLEDPAPGSTRHSVVKSGGRVIATISYTPAGAVRTVSVGALVLSLELVDGRVHETLSANGRQIAESTVVPVFGRSFRIGLDTVAARLGLTARWPQEVTARSSPAGYLTILQAGERVVARIVQLGANRVAFDAEGAVLFYDLALNSGVIEDGPNQVQVNTAYAAAVPTHLIVGSDGTVGAYAENPGDGAIRAFWSKDGAYSYSIYHNPPGGGTASARPAVAPRSAEARHTASVAAFRNIQPLLFTVCSSATVCSGIVGDPSSEDCVETQYWCNIDNTYGGGGTYYGGGDGGTAGGGGSTAGGNYVSNPLNPALKQAVARGIDTAQQKLTASECSEQLLKDTQWSGTNAWDLLQTKGVSASQWFSKIAWYYGGSQKDASGRVPCNAPGTFAWTMPGSTTDYVCDAFSTIASTWLTPQQIDSLVQAHCGS